VDLERHDAAGVGAWLAAHRAEVLTAVRGCDRDGLRRLGTRLAYAIWPVAGLVDDPGWWVDLARAGEAVAIADRDPRMLAGLLHRSAGTFAAAGDRLRAEEQWVRALAIVRRGELGERELAILTGMSELYRDWGRLSKALDAELAIVELHRATKDPGGTASALARVADTMLAADRPSSAVSYLSQADDVLTAVDLPALHAQVITSWGRALWVTGEHGAARRQWSRALALLIDFDDAAADHLRELLASAPDSPLPEDYPIGGSGGRNTSSSSSGGKG
jgi:tetratricopeptide (TPR) repeat protein